MSYAFEKSWISQCKWRLRGLSRGLCDTTYSSVKVPSLWVFYLHLSSVLPACFPVAQPLSLLDSFLEITLCVSIKPIPSLPPVLCWYLQFLKFPLHLSASPSFKESLTLVVLTAWFPRQRQDSTWEHTRKVKPHVYFKCIVLLLISKHYIGHSG